MKSLPKIYKNEDIHPKNHNRNMVHVREKQPDNKKIEEVIDNLFYKIGSPYHKKIWIKTKEKEYRTFIIAKDKKNLYTLENEAIEISSIIDIEELITKKD